MDAIIKTDLVNETSHDSNAQKMRQKISNGGTEYTCCMPNLSDEMLLLIKRNTERFMASECGSVNIYSSHSLAEAMDKIEKNMSNEDKERLAEDIELLYQVIEYFDYMDMGELYYDIEDV